MLVRLFLYLLVLAPLVYGGIWLSEQPGTVAFEWQGYLVTTTMPAFVTALAISFIMLSLVVLIIRSIFALPGSFSRRQKLRGYEKGIGALTGTMSSLAIGDHNSAHKQLRKARYYLGSEAPSTRMLAVQLAHAEGKKDAARIELTAMLDDETTRPLALRGTISALMADKQWRQAYEHTKDLITLRPKDRWATIILVNLAMRQQQWDQVATIIHQARRADAITRAEVHHYLAILQTARAANCEHHEKSKALLHDALIEQADFLPAELMMAALLADAQDRSALVKHLAKAWKHQPHPGYIDMFIEHFGNEPAAKLKKILAKIVGSQPDDVESQLAQVRVAIHLSDWETARNILKICLSKRESGRIFQLFAQVESGESGDEKQAAGWLQQAVSAPRDMVWQCGNCSAIHEHWRVHCTTCDQFDTISWQLPGTTRTVNEALLVS